MTPICHNLIHSNFILHRTIFIFSYKIQIGMSNVEIEFCIESLPAAKAAEEYKVNRVEVCSDLAADGLSPSNELIKECREVFSGDIYAMIRPRPGNFCYSSKEVETMQKQINNFAKCGIDGVVFGLLDSERKINLNSCVKLIKDAKTSGLGITFHRAFDVCKDPMTSMETLYDLGFDRILTSGQENTAIEGLELLKELVQTSNKRIDIMAGSGVNPASTQILIDSGVQALHFSVHNKELPQSAPNYILRDKIEGVLNQIR